ncbi:N-acetylglucosamine-binding protein GbpA [Erwinia tasmaniensis]|uniref:Chitin-binding protein, domain 3 n=1 Tax=Erwinia tasmaniensis (strain DSM 17950 / CFBP 7177 / CIP 109463 / NCPPB 4357 / Et1/99) TaxID=465817 RepID=B2VHZ6_ERWT9|nr:Chitin-binding protein, domain 3 [Erwinia tasmaniensis Et1/99]
MKFNKLALAITTLLVSGSVLAHGYITTPPSRDTMCKMSKNNTEICGDQVQYNTSSIGESPKGFPGNINTPPDGKLPSGTGSAAPMSEKLNLQTADMWAKSPIKAGEYKFTWEITAPHKTTNFNYFITKQGWDANKPLTRDSFETVPFCVNEMNGVAPLLGAVSHDCVLPERTGYQVIYAAWEISDTGNTFYKVIDVDFGNAIPSEFPKSVGEINPTIDLKAGDTASVRVFEDTEKSSAGVTLKINSDAEGKKEVWSKALAELINKEYKDVRAGILNEDGTVEPAAGRNNIYAKKDSAISAIHLELETEQVAPLELEVNKLKKEYKLTDGAVKIDVTGSATPESKVTAELISKTRKQGKLETAVVGADGKFKLLLEGSNLKAGISSVVVKATTQNGAAPKQDTQNVKLTANAGGGNVEAEFTYPEGIEKYVSGTTVQQAKNGKVYQCKEGAVAGWCRIYSSSANQFEPGVGSNWQDAWNEVGAAKKAH